MAIQIKKTQNYKLVLTSKQSPTDIFNFYISEITINNLTHCEGFRHDEVSNNWINGLSHFGFITYEELKTELLKDPSWEFTSEAILDSYEETLDNYLTSETVESKGETNEIDKSNKKG